MRGMRGDVKVSRNFVDMEGRGEKAAFGAFNWDLLGGFDKADFMAAEVVLDVEAEVCGGGRGLVS